MRAQFSIVRAGSACPLFKLAALALAMALTLSCSSDKDDDKTPSGNGGGGNNSGNSGVDGSSSSVATGSGNGSSSSATSGGGSSSSATASGGSSSSATGSVGSSSSAGGGSTNCGERQHYCGSSSSAGGGAASETVVIGGKTWQAKNLSVDVPGSKCYAEGVSGVSADSVAKNCAKYGRLYDWATAMALPSKCNSTLSTDDAECAIRTPNHQGICPSGWHIPSDAEWTALTTAVGGESTAGKHLKAKEGWTDCGPSGSGKANLCEDTYNFSALPGGFGDSNGGFLSVGNYGLWWSASEDIAYGAYRRDMYFNNESIIRDYHDKSYYLLSVRCLQD